MADLKATNGPSARASAILLLGFLAVCFAVGYPAFSRYDPRKEGNYDAGCYYRMVLGGPVGAPAGYRLLTPTLARGVHGVVSRLDVGSWDPVLLSLWIVNAVFVSLSALILMHIAAAVRPDTAVVILSPLIYLSSFVVVNFHLAGLVDAGEALCLTALLYAMLRDRWLPIPLLIGVGALAKETVVPLGVCAMVVWWAVARAGGKRMPRSSAVAIPVALALGAVSLFACRWLVDVPAYEAHQFSWTRLARMPGNAIDCLFTRTQVYAFALLLPLGIPRLLKIPTPLLVASLGMAVLATLLGAYAAIDDNLHRPLFNTLGPILVISTAIFLRDLTTTQRPDPTNPQSQI